MVEILEGLFIKDNGDLYSARSGKVLRPTVGSSGYLEYTTRIGGKKKKKLYQHRLVAIAFLPNPNNYEVVNHKDGNKSNNALSNLEWCTHKQNSEHAWRTGLINNNGSKMGNARWTDEQVRLLRAYHRQGHSLEALCRANNCPKATMSQMLNRKTYRDVQ